MRIDQFITQKIEQAGASPEDAARYARVSLEALSEVLRWREFDASSSTPATGPQPSSSTPAAPPAAAPAAAPAAPVSPAGLVYQAAPAFWPASTARPVRGITPAAAVGPAPPNVQISTTQPAPSGARVEITNSTGQYQAYSGELQPGESRVEIRNPDGSITRPQKGPGDLLFGAATPPVLTPATPAGATPVASFKPAGLASEVSSVRLAQELSPSKRTAMQAILDGRTPDPAEAVALSALGLVVAKNGTLELTQEGREAFYIAGHLQPQPEAGGAP